MELLHEQCGNPEASQQQQETERERGRVGSVQDTWLSGLAVDESRKCIMHHLAYALLPCLPLPRSLSLPLPECLKKRTMQLTVRKQLDWDRFSHR